MATIQVKDANGTIVYLEVSSGAGTELDPYVSKTVVSATNLDIRDLSSASDSVAVGTALPAGDNNIGNVDLASAIPAGTNNIGDVDVASIAAGENHIGEISGNSARITPSITVSTSPAYSSGDSIGGKITLTGALRASGKAAVLTSIHLLDRANQKPTGSILIFNADPSSATITDNGAFVYSTDDLKQIAKVDIVSGDWTTINSKATAHIKNIGSIVSAASGTDLYAAFVTTSTPTFAATTDVQISFGFLRD